jgi:hypothetical protein
MRVEKTAGYVRKNEKKGPNVGNIAVQHKGVPMRNTITEAEKNVEKAMASLVRITKSNDTDERKLNDVEKELWSLLLSLGRCLIALFLARRAAKKRPGFYEYEQKRFFIANDKTRSSEVGTIFGKVVFTRPVGRPNSNCRGAADLVVDRELGLVSGFSLLVVLQLVRLCAQLPFARARETFRDFFEWVPSPRATLRMVDAVGPAALEYMLKAPCPEDDGEVLVIECDAGGNPTISSTEYEKRCTPKNKQKPASRQGRKEKRKTHKKPVRAKGKKSKNAKAAIIGVVYTLRTKDGVVEGPLNKRVIATHASHEQLFKHMAVVALKRGYGKKKTVFLSDGSKHILERQRRFFPDAIPCLDWCHATEYLWKACSSFRKEGSKKLNRTAQWLKRRMLSGDIVGVISFLEQKLAGIPKTGPGNKGKREKLSKTISYLDNNKERLRYGELRKAGLPIGSGVVEGTVRNLIRQRLDCSGMRWGLDRAEHVLHLRCVFLNKQWDLFGSYLETKNLRLAAQPQPARPYDAKPIYSKSA